LGAARAPPRGGPAAPTLCALRLRASARMRASPLRGSARAAPSSFHAPASERPAGGSGASRRPAHPRREAAAHTRSVPARTIRILAYPQAVQELSAASQLGAPPRKSPRPMKSRNLTQLELLRRRITRLDEASVDRLYGLEPVWEPGSAAPGVALEEFVAVRCPYCGERLEPRVELSGAAIGCHGGSGEYEQVSRNRVGDRRRHRDHGRCGRRLSRCRGLTRSRGSERQGREQDSEHTAAGMPR